MLIQLVLLNNILPTKNIVSIKYVFIGLSFFNHFKLSQAKFFKVYFSTVANANKHFFRVFPLLNHKNILNNKN